MSVQLTKTKAEQALSAGFVAAEGRLPGNDAVQKLRREAIGAFEALGLPHRRVEEWRYTDLRNVLRESFVNATGGTFGSQAIAETLDGQGPGLLSGLDAYTVILADGAFVTSTLPVGLDGVEVLPLAEAMDKKPEWMARRIAETGKAADGVVALNTATMSGGVAIRIADGVTLDKPLQIVFAATGAEAKLVTTRSIVDVGKNAVLTLVETHVATANWMRQHNTLVQITVDDGAHMRHVKNVSIAAGSLHLSNTLVRIGASAAYTPFQLTTGGGVVRHGLDLRFEGSHSSFDFAALALPDMSGHVDTTLVVDHRVPRCTSRELYKCVLDGTARGVFQGKVIVQPGAQKTDGKQMAQALMLSPNAEFDSKPELEIYADDVVCGHGSTSAELDEDLLFYCRSRGIPKEEARALLIESFIGEVIDKVEHEGLRVALASRAEAWLRAGHV